MQQIQIIMTYSAGDKLTAMAIVSVFETGRAFGKFSTVAVLNDGAGISYGFSQFTHKSGALAAVLDRYLAIGGVIGRAVVETRMTDVEKRTSKTISSLAADTAFRNALRAAGITNEMKRAQIEIAVERFLGPAVNECSRLGFSLPLSLAVVYDSMTHGSWEKIRNLTAKSSPPYEGGVAAASADGVVLSYEQNWIVKYVSLRDAWLGSVPRLATTRYRTRFFQKQIAAQNWEVKLPLRVQRVTITDTDINAIEQYLDEPDARQTSSAVGPSLDNDPAPTLPQTSQYQPQAPPSAQPPELLGGEKGRQGEKETIFDRVESTVNAATETYDQVGRIATGVTSRTDAAKSFWTAVIGSITQTFWAVVGLIAGIPREVWFVVAVIAAVLMVMYLYRQIELGKIREKQISNSKFQISN